MDLNDEGFQKTNDWNILWNPQSCYKHLQLHTILSKHSTIVVPSYQIASPLITPSHKYLTSFGVAESKPVTHHPFSSFATLSLSSSRFSCAFGAPFLHWVTTTNPNPLTGPREPGVAACCFRHGELSRAHTWATPVCNRRPHSVRNWPTALPVPIHSWWRPEISFDPTREERTHTYTHTPTRTYLVHTHTHTYTRTPSHIRAHTHPHTQTLESRRAAYCSVVPVSHGDSSVVAEEGRVRGTQSQLVSTVYPFRGSGANGHTDLCQPFACAVGFVGQNQCLCVFFFCRCELFFFDVVFFYRFMGFLKGKFGWLYWKLSDRLRRFQNVSLVFIFSNAFSRSKRSPGKFQSRIWKEGKKCGKQSLDTFSLPKTNVTG